MRIAAGAAVCGLRTQASQLAGYGREAADRTILAGPVQGFASAIGLATRFSALGRIDLHRWMGVPAAENRFVPRPQPVERAAQVDLVCPIPRGVLRLSPSTHWPARNRGGGADRGALRRRQRKARRPLCELPAVAEPDLEQHAIC